MEGSLFADRVKSKNWDLEKVGKITVNQKCF